MYLANWVPVGVDQLPHLELAREIVRRFHFLYGEGVLVEPQPKLTEFPKIPGTDGRKMSKSYGNSIFLSDTAEETATKILGVPKERPGMVTDPARVRRTDPGDPDKCPVFMLHRVATPEAERVRLAAGCRTAGIGCIECKRALVAHLNESLAPLRLRRAQLAAEPGLVERILAEGTARARDEAARVMAAVRAAVRL
jgi:tryptophanyl-tRNA synthetase